jgi:hypothetical protein
MSANPNSHVLCRIRAEYIEMPGLRLKSEQVQRLCGVDGAACQTVLDTLVGAGFLSLRPDGSYVRSRDFETAHASPAKATLESPVMAAVSRIRKQAS